MSSKRLKEIMKYKDLRMKMLGHFEDLYFQDMTFQKKTILNKIAKLDYFLKGSSGKTESYIDDSWTSEYSLHHWLIVYTDNQKYKLDHRYAGICLTEKKIIIIRRKRIKKKEDNIILHEMIHAYESALPEDLKQFLILYLYKNLEKRIGYKKLWQCIYLDSHMDFKAHTPLFMLKSITLDLQTKQPLGTIYSYERVKYFK